MTQNNFIAIHQQRPFPFLVEPLDRVELKTFAQDT